MAGPVSVTCPTCGEAFPVPTEILGVDSATDQVIVRMDRTELYGHLTACVRRRAVEVATGVEKSMESHPAGKGKPSERDLAGRVDQLLDGGHYVAKGGSRACTMCGTPGDTCLTKLRKGKRACCPLCADGNTHRAPGEDTDCQIWGAQHGAAD